MPLYHYQCPKCLKERDEFNRIKDRNSVICSCGERMIRPIRQNKTFLDIWKPLTLEHIADEPMTFNSRKELTKYCRENKVSSGALL